MKRNLRLLLLTFAISLPFWWGIDLFSETTGRLFLQWQLENGSGVLSAHASQDIIEQKLQEAYPLAQKGREELSLQARGASSVLVKEDGSQKLLFSQNAESPFLIASLTKLMTALVAMESYSPTETVPITPEILIVEGEGGQLKLGEVFTVRELLYLALIESSNDAATALTVPLGYPLFIEKMNEQAASLNMKTASFANPTGLDGVNANYASARDLTNLAVHLKEHYPQVFDILSQQQFPIYTADQKFHHNLINTNELLGFREWPAKVLGGKTGWTPAAKQSLVLVVESPDKKGYIVNVLLGSEDRFGEMKKLLRWTLHSYQWKQPQ